MAKRTLENVAVKKETKVTVPKLTAKRISEAAVVLGTSSWQARTERFTPDELSTQLSAAGKLGGRPRKIGTR